MLSIEQTITYISDLLASIWNILSHPDQLIDDLASTLLDLMNEYGLDPVYTLTVLVNLITLSYWGCFRNWKTQSDHTKHFAIIHVIVAAMFNLWSLLKLLGVIDF